MSRYFKITVTECVAPDVTQGTALNATISADMTVFQQSFDAAEFNLRAFVQTLNATPRRRRKTAKGETT